MVLASIQTDGGSDFIRRSSQILQVFVNFDGNMAVAFWSRIPCGLVDMN